ncbi:hypothetical protein F2Q68_00040520 [Brassica cretica]|uniref:Uncharacterized protein n=1 Tax=Brassica cretica TaxID=69181 RepID=A0A8S9ME44_BRACR|nr:hypothetical protein F2Q68_00040520 [Brassica cretica]
MELIDHIREKENEGSGAPSWRAMRQAAESSHRRWLGHGMVVMVVCFQKSRSEQRRESYDLVVVSFASYTSIRSNSSNLGGSTVLLQQLQEHVGGSFVCRSD